MQSKKFFACLFASLLLFQATFAQEVLVLTPDNFDQVITENKLILVEFFAPWCGHCKRLAPEYEAAAAELKSEIPLASVDADAEANRPLAQRYGVQGYPTLKVFRNGVPSDYKGGRTKAEIVSYMRKQALPAISILSTVEEVTSFSQKDRVVIVGFFSSQDAPEYSLFKDLAEEMRDNFMFGAVFEAKNEIGSTQGITLAPSIVLYKAFDERKNIKAISLESTNLEEEIRSFIAVSSVPLVDEIGANNYRNYVEAQLPLAYIFVDLTKEGQLEQYVTDEIREKAKATRGVLNWVYIDFAKYARHGERLGLSGTKCPAFAIENMQTGQHWAFSESQDPTPAAILQFTDDFLSGSLPPTIRSEDVPTSDEGPVKKIVAKNFQEIVIENEKNVFLEFYAPWCGHCKHLAPVWEELGAIVQKQGWSSSLVIAKIDATANDVDPKYGVTGFPTLKLFKKGLKDTPINYEGDRSKADLLRFLQQNIENEIDFSGVKDEL